MNDEVLLTRLIERLQPSSAPDAAGIARGLMQIHGSLGPLLDTEAEDLAAMSALNPATAQMLSLIPQIARYMARERVTRYTNLSTLRRACRYLDGLYLGAKQECFYLLSLDASGKLLDCSLVQTGTVDEVPFYLRRVLEIALRANAGAVILTHNHPSGTSRHSSGDIRCVRDAIDLLNPLGIWVLDHILCASGRFYSLQSEPNYHEELFGRQRPDADLLRGWLGPEEEDEAIP